MTTISDLSVDCVGEILSRVPLTSLSAVRSTCQTWNDLSKVQILGQKARKKQLLEFMMINHSVSSLRVDLQGIRNIVNDEDVDLVETFRKKISIPNHHQVKISKVCHCDGLLLCVTEDQDLDLDHRRLLVWNPYLGQTRLIKSIHKFERLYRLYDTYALGYDNNRNHKILKLSSGYTYFIEVYDFSSDSWRVLDVDPPGWDCDELCRSTFVCFKGNTYFFYESVIGSFLVCFDFATERFGPRLPLPFNINPMTKFWGGDEKLAALDCRCDMIEIWITTKIEPNDVSWSTCLRLDARPTSGIITNFEAGSFFIDEEKKVAVLLDIVLKIGGPASCIIGKDGYFKFVNNGKTVFHWWNSKFSKPVCSPYVPSLVQLQINQPDKGKERDDRSVTSIFNILFVSCIIFSFLFSFWCTY